MTSCSTLPSQALTQRAPAAPRRRDFLRVAGGSALLAHWLAGGIARAQGAAPARRLMIIHRPNGTVPDQWIRNGQRGPILEAFAGVWAHAVALKGVDVRPSVNDGGSHEAGLLTLMTGARAGATQRTTDDYRSTAESLDQTLLKRAAVLGGRPVPSLQLGAHGDQDGGNEVPNVTLSYSGAASPLYPVLRPDDVFRRLFGSLAPDAAALARNRRQSVLGFVKADLTRVRTQLPAEFRGDLDVYETAIREVERSLEAAAPPAAACTVPAAPGTALEPGYDAPSTERVAAAQFRLVSAAFACDLTRVVTFQWATGASNLQFDATALGGGVGGTSNHHETSHSGSASARAIIAATERWYAQRTAAFIQQLADAADPAGGGRLIDNTLVWYLNEVADGLGHTHNDYPFVLFGGNGVGLRTRGRILDVSGQGRTSNDVWSALAPSFGTTLGPFGTAASGALPGLFG
jgi:hypothetical protein